MELNDCAIIGGGVSGLALAIQLANAGKKTVLFEKENYPFHKVCGEYISNESVPFLKSLGVDLRPAVLPQIKNLLMSSPSGISLQVPLALGGTGLSRYELDNQLFKLALTAGVNVQSGVKVHSVNFNNDRFTISAGGTDFMAKIAAGAYGKNSNIDAQLGLSYRAASENSLFIAVKHHIRVDFDPAFVHMHNFNGGYCGLSAIEDGKINLSYISKVANLKKHKTIAGMEKKVLSQNPFLKKYFDSAEFIFDKPLTISHLQFQLKQVLANHVLMLGDAAGNIAPLSGNGMSMGLYSSRIASAIMLDYLDNKLTRNEMEQKYLSEYRAAFASRIKIARFIHGFFGKPFSTDLGFRFLKTFPGFVGLLSERIHGPVF